MTLELELPRTPCLKLVAVYDGDVLTWMSVIDPVEDEIRLLAEDLVDHGYVDPDGFDEGKLRLYTTYDHIEENHPTLPSVHDDAAVEQHGAVRDRFVELVKERMA